MELLNRQQFIDMFNGLQEGLGGPGSPLWALEDTGELCQWFVCVKPLVLTADIKSNFYAWCHQNLRGRILCFSSDGENEEWWGFSDADDAFWWTLRWGK